MSFISPTRHKPLGRRDVAFLYPYCPATNVYETECPWALLCLPGSPSWMPGQPAQPDMETGPESHVLGTLTGSEPRPHCVCLAHGLPHI